MDSKHPLPLPQPAQDSMKPASDVIMDRRRLSKSRFQIAAAVILLSVFWLARTWNSGHKRLEKETNVPLEVHIMSKCPDAQACLRDLIVPTMANVSEKVDFKLSFIGSVSHQDDDVQCMHGQTECVGNILMLCAASEYPDPKLYLGFTYCLLKHYEDIPSESLAEDCALEHGLDFGILNDCMSRDTGAHGMGLLRDSVQHSKDVGVGTSCTIRLNNQVRCIYDGGEWRDCDNGSKPDDLIHDIKKLYSDARIRYIRERSLQIKAFRWR